MATRCWALNTDGERCELPADHMDDPTSLHEISQTWSDDECYVPPQTVTLAAREYGPLFPVSAGIAPPPMPGDSDECLICDHKMHRGMCQFGECDCKNGMPK